MLLENKITRFSKHKSLYTNGDVVYLDFSRESKKENDIMGPYTVLNVSLNTTTRVFMYSFVETTICVGENYLKSDVDDEPLSIKEVIRDNGDNIGILDEGLDVKTGNIIADGVKTFSGKPALLFFKPNKEFLQWIVEYAAGRIIIDVGCGVGFMTERMADLGARIFGIDPYFSAEDNAACNRSRINRNKNILHFFSKEVEDCSDIIKGLGSKGLMLFCRPCHNNFVENALHMRAPGMEALYITLPDNMTKYDDLGMFKKDAIQIIHNGSSIDKEKVFCIKPKH